jgi:hypothetical protein
MKEEAKKREKRRERREGGRGRICREERHVVEETRVGEGTVEKRDTTGERRE